MCTNKYPSFCFRMLFHEDSNDAAHFCVKCDTPDFLGKCGCLPSTSVEKNIQSPAEDVPTDQFLSFLQLQRRTETPASDKPLKAAMVTRSMTKTPLEKNSKKYSGVKRKYQIRKRKQSECKNDEEIGEEDVWMTFDRGDRSPLPSRQINPDMYSVSPSFMMDLGEVRDTEVDTFLDDVKYDDYVNLIDMEDINYYGGKGDPKKQASSPNTWAWDHEEEDSEVSKINKNRKIPPSSYTGGKWKPSDHETGKHSPEITYVPEFPRYPSPSHTRGKWKPPDPMEPPVEHTRGKWAPTYPQKCLKTSGGGVGYYCSTCRRRLASKQMYNKHIRSDYHRKRAVHENDLECDVRSSKNIGKRGMREGLRNLKMRQTKEEFDGKKNRRKKDVCVVCRIKIQKGKLGNHLVSYHHYRRWNMNEVGHRNQVSW